MSIVIAKTVTSIWSSSNDPRNGCLLIVLVGKWLLDYNILDAISHALIPITEHVGF